MADQPAAEVRAAGTVLSRHAESGAEVALIHRSRYDDWSLPKGKREPGEHLLETAVREVAEETGIRVILGRLLGHASYQSFGRPKRVDYWAARPATPVPVPASSRMTRSMRWTGCPSRRRRDG